MVIVSKIGLLMPPAYLRLFGFSSPFWFWLVLMIVLYLMLSAIGATLFNINQEGSWPRKYMKVTMKGWAMSFAAQLLSLLIVFGLYTIMLTKIGFNGFVPQQSGVRIVFLAAAVLLASLLMYYSLMHIALKKEISDVLKRKKYVLFMTISIGFSIIVFNWTGAYSWLLIW